MPENRKSLQEEFEPLFNPRAVAVIGATNNWSKWGFSTWNSLLDGYKGKVYPVNNRDKEVLGHRAYSRVIDIPEDEPVDLAVFVIPAEGVPSVMEDCVQKGVRAAVIISAGFAETGEEGKKLQDEVVRIARKGPLRFIGGNCMGFWSATANLKAFMFPLLVMDGPLAMVSQGGNIGGSVVSAGYTRGIGFRSYVSCGCTADIQVEDYIEYFGDDPKIEVILAYIEGVNDGTRFTEKVSRVSAKKPVIALKPGKTEAATTAITSHSGALAGSSTLYDSAFKKAGIMRVNTPEELLDTGMGFVTQPLPRGKKIAIISPGGSYGVLTADTCASMGLEVIKLSDETIAEFDKILPPRWSHGNPVDPAGDRNFIAYMQAPDLLLKLPEVDSLIYMGFTNFSGWATRFSGINKDITKIYQELIQELTKLIPGKEALEDPRTDESWMEELTKKLVESFFAVFGTTDSTDLEAFSQKLTSIFKNKKVGPKLKEQFLRTAKSFHNGTIGENMNPFGPVLEALMEGLLITWIKTYDKPVITTSFMEMSTVSKLGYHAYPTPERAATVLTKMMEYREYLEQKGIVRIQGPSPP